MSVNIRSSQVAAGWPAGASGGVAVGVIEALDSPPTTPDRVTKLVATKPASHDRVRPHLQVLQNRQRDPPAGSASLVVDAVSTKSTRRQLRRFDRHRRLRPSLRPVNQPPDNRRPQCTATWHYATRRIRCLAALPKRRWTPQSWPKQLAVCLGPVQVEFVEGLDVIVLRGSERDVQRVMDIIKQIEELERRHGARYSDL